MANEPYNNGSTRKVESQQGEPEHEEEAPRQMVESFARFVASVGPSYPPIMHKMEPQQISEVIKSIDDADMRNFRDKELTRRYIFGFALLAVALLVFFTYEIAPDDPALYADILKFLGAFVVGFGGGYGFGKAKRNQ